MKKIKSINIIGRRWFQRTYGNTYHTAQVMVNGVTVWKSGKTYGYDDQYVQTALAWLEANGYMPGRVHYDNGGAESGWRYFRDDRGVEYHTEAIDVPREKDL